MLSGRDRLANLEYKVEFLKIQCNEVYNWLEPYHIDFNLTWTYISCLCYSEHEWFKTDLPTYLLCLWYIVSMNGLRLIYFVSVIVSMNGSRLTYLHIYFVSAI